MPGPRSDLPYDAGLHMYVQPVRRPDPRRLGFLRWLAEHDRTDDGPALGPSSGPLSADYPPPPRTAAPGYSSRA